MRNLVLQTIYEGSDCTLGDLGNDDVKFATLERPWQDNLNNISCIPESPINPATSERIPYLCTHFEGSESATAECWQINGVPNREDVLLHIGNFVRNTKGCILIGTDSGRMDGEKAVIHSTIALERLKEYIGRDDEGKLLPFMLTVIRL